MQTYSRRHILVALLLAPVAALLTNPILAHDADCPLCSLPVVQDTADQDNEVKVRYGRKRIEYRCVYCALSEAHSELTEGDVTIAAPSEKKGEAIVIKRVSGQWSAPQGVLFAAKKTSHRVCPITYRAFSSRAGFEAWIKAHPDQFDKESQPLKFAQMLKLAKAPGK